MDIIQGLPKTNLKVQIFFQQDQVNAGDAVEDRRDDDYMREVRKWQSLEYLTKGSQPPEPYRWLGEYDERHRR